MGRGALAIQHDRLALVLDLLPFERVDEALLEK
jgi:hypothetical protein